MKQMKEPRPLTEKERKGLAIFFAIIFLGIVVYGLIDLLFPFQ